MDPHYVFFESVDGSLVHTGGDPVNLDDLKITEKCSIDGNELLPCPWKPAPSECWEASTFEVKAVMRRKLVDHYELDPAGTYTFTGGFSVMELLDNGAIVKGENGEEEGLELSLNAQILGVSLGVVAVLVAAVF